MAASFPTPDGPERTNSRPTDSGLFILILGSGLHIRVEPLHHDLRWQEAGNHMAAVQHYHGAQLTMLADVQEHASILALADHPANWRRAARKNCHHPT